MKLTLFTDYSIRVLLYLAARPDRLCSIPEIARAYGVSQNHLTKVVHELARAGYVATARGRFGGIRLGRAPEDINVGALIRFTEENFDLVECGTCIITQVCGLPRVLKEALAAFLAVLDRYTIADLMAGKKNAAALALGQASSSGST
jgi:Rrf2 family transcriptional regulator, nitric oxide-sensitive transcriptional repressor